MYIIETNKERLLGRTANPLFNIIVTGTNKDNPKTCYTCKATLTNVYSTLLKGRVITYQVMDFCDNSCVNKFMQQEFQGFPCICKICNALCFTYNANSRRCSDHLSEAQLNALDRKK